MFLTFLISCVQRVMPDRDLARVYGLPAKVFKQQVKRNKVRFPDDFCFDRKRSQYCEATICDLSKSIEKKQSISIKNAPIVG